MRYFQISLIGCLLLISSICYAVNHSQPDIRKIEQRGYIIVAIPNFHYPPFFFINKQGKLQGFDVTLAQNIAKHFGVKLKIDRQPKTFDDVVDAITNGKVDLGLCNLSETLDRAKRISYTTPYLTMHLALLLNRTWLAQMKQKDEKKNIMQILHQPKQRIGVLQGSSYATAANQLFPQAKIVNYPTIAAEFSDLMHRKISVALHDEVQIKRFLLSHPEATLRLRAIVLSNHPDLISGGVNYKNRALLHWLNIYLQLNNISHNADSVLKDTVPNNSAN